jgi:NAD-dependent deacetylase
MNIVFFTGAGISEESGIPTFRTGENSIWNRYDPDIVCNVRAWPYHKEKILSFFNEVRSTVEKCESNYAHFDIANLEHKHNVTVITTNIDNLHEKAGSSNVIHLHGNIFESCDINYHHTEPCHTDINIGDVHPKSNSQLRHNVVMFGEMPYQLDYAQRIISEANILVVVGTSLSVYPAAGLVERFKGEIYYIDPEAVKITENTIPIKAKATYGIKAFKQYIGSRNII